MSDECRKIGSSLPTKEKEWQDLFNEVTLKKNFSVVSKITDKWGIIRQLYMENISDIYKYAEKNLNVWGADPYALDWMDLFSPIEKIAWNSIRNRPLPLYPQFSLFNFFIDFANPYLRIGIELDGEDFHDEEKDRIRDTSLANYGWKIFRIKGKECYRRYKNHIDLHDENIPESEWTPFIRDWLLNTCDGVIKSIYDIYFNKNEEDRERYIDISTISLQQHTLVDFDLFTAIS